MTAVEPQPTRLGHYAGPVTRALAFLVDVTIAVIVFEVTVAVCFYLLDLVFHADVQTDDIPAWITALVFAAWLFVYFGQLKKQPLLPTREVYLLEA